MWDALWEFLETLGAAGEQLRVQPPFLGKVVFSFSPVAMNPFEYLRFAS